MFRAVVAAGGGAEKGLELTYVLLMSPCSSSHCVLAIMCSSVSIRSWHKVSESSIRLSETASFPVLPPHQERQLLLPHFHHCLLS